MALTDASRLAVRVFTQVWEDNRIRQRRQIFTLFREETEIANDNNGTGYPFPGFYAALFMLPRYRFQYIRNVPGWFGTTPTNSFEAMTFDNRFTWVDGEDGSRVVLIRGIRYNYLSNLTVGEEFRFGVFTSFTSDYSTAVRFMRRYDAPSPTLILLEEEQVQESNINSMPAYARPIDQLSVKPEQREYLIDPVTTFRVVSIWNTTVDRRDKIKINVIRIRFINRGLQKNDKRSMG